MKKKKRGRGHALPRNTQEQGKRKKLEMIRKVLGGGRRMPRGAKNIHKRKICKGRERRGEGGDSPPARQKEGKWERVEGV